MLIKEFDIDFEDGYKIPYKKKPTKPYRNPNDNPNPKSQKKEILPNYICRICLKKYTVPHFIHDCPYKLLKDFEKLIKVEEVTLKESEEDQQQTITLEKQMESINNLNDFFEVQSKEQDGISKELLMLSKSSNQTAMSVITNPSNTNKILKLVGKIDTGSSVTMISEVVVNELKLIPQLTNMKLSLADEKTTEFLATRINLFLPEFNKNYKKLLVGILKGVKEFNSSNFKRRTQYYIKNYKRSRFNMKQIEKFYHKYIEAGVLENILQEDDTNEIKFNSSFIVTTNSKENTIIAIDYSQLLKILLNQGTEFPSITLTLSFIDDYQSITFGKWIEINISDGSQNPRPCKMINYMDDIIYLISSYEDVLKKGIALLEVCNENKIKLLELRISFYVTAENFLPFHDAAKFRKFKWNHKMENASKSTYEARLSQRLNDGSINTIAHISFKFSSTQLNWSIPKKELFFAKSALKKFDFYVHERSVNLVLDAKAIVLLANNINRNKNNRILTQWIQEIFTNYIIISVIPVPREENNTTDKLSKVQ
eukprot:gene11882-5209_t